MSENVSPELKKTLRADLTVAMKSHDEVTKGTLRMLIAAVQAEEVAGSQARELSDAEVLKVLAREAKKRAEAAEVFDKNGRGELAVKERAESEVIARYLPTQLSDSELNEIVSAAFAQVEAEVGEKPTMRQMGQVMKLATAAAAGRADGSRLSAAVRALL